jgi:hypothetical protein
MNPTWIVVAVTGYSHNDNETDMGSRIWSQVFETYSAADLAYKHIKQNAPDAKVILIENYFMGE